MLGTVSISLSCLLMRAWSRSWVQFLPLVPVLLSAAARAATPSYRHRQEPCMTRMRVALIVLALAAMPFVAVAAQGNSETCNDAQARTVAEARRSGKQVPPGLAKKCPPPPAPVPPAPVPPPSPVPPPAPAPEPGIHKALGIVYEEIDEVAGRDPFSGEMGLMGWTLQLYDAGGLLLASTTTDASGNFEFAALANGTYSVCVVGQSGYTQTAPTSGTGCGGLGHTFSISGMLETWRTGLDFGMMAAQ